MAQKSIMPLLPRQMRAVPQHTDLPLILADQQSRGHWHAQKSRPPALGGQSPASPQRLMRRLCFWLKTEQTRPSGSFKRLEYRAVHCRGKALVKGRWRRELESEPAGPQTTAVVEGREQTCFSFLKSSLGSFSLKFHQVWWPEDYKFKVSLSTN